MIKIKSQVADPGTGEGGRWAKMRTHRIMTDMLARFGASSKLIFFSSIRRHTRFDCDWSSDVCSSDLSFDVASIAEFLNVHQKIEHLSEKERQDFIWDRIIYANPIKAIETLELLEPYKPLVTYDNHDEVIKIARHAPHAGLVLRIRVPNTGSMVELSSKFGALPGEAVDLISFAHNNKLEVEGLSFHVGSQ